MVEDGLTGTGSNWAQQNYYSGGSQGGDMAWWNSQGSPVTGIEFNHVAVAGWSVQDGVANSVAKEFTADTELKYTYTGSISGNSLIQDKTKLTAVALLIDRTSGTIVNAAKSVIADYGTGIGEVNGRPMVETQSIYDLSGRQIVNGKSSNSKLPKGINIIRMSDGTVKKVLVK